MKNIPFYLHDLGEEEIEAVLSVLKSNWINTGAKEREFNEQLKSYLGIRRCQLFNSATSALFSTLKAFGIEEGDEIITSSYTFCASANVAIQAGGRPVLCDVKNDFNIDPKEIEKKITSKTKAIIPVDFGGLPCDMDSIEKVLEEKRRLFQPKNPLQEKLGRPLILTDAAHSLGSAYKGKKTGLLGDLSVFSFHVVKNITTGDGGAVVANPNSPLSSDDFFLRLKQISLHGMDKTAMDRANKSGYDYDVKELGYKFNLKDIEAALGLVQLKRFPHFIERRKRLARLYDEAFEHSPFQLWDYNQKEIDNVYHLYPLLLPKNLKRDKVFAELKDNFGVVCNVHFKPIPLLTYYKERNYDIFDYPKALELYERELSLPFYTQLKDEEALYIAESLKSMVK